MGRTLANSPLSLALSHTRGEGKNRDLLRSSLPWRERVRERGNRNGPIIFIEMNC
jgi:hypothetical protein